MFININILLMLYSIFGHLPKNRNYIKFRRKAKLLLDALITAQ